MEGDGDQNEHGTVCVVSSIQAFGAAGKDVNDRECWRKMIFAIATPHGSWSRWWKLCDCNGWAVQPT